MSDDFEEVQFPVAISMGSTGGPLRQTQIVITGSGAERRNSRWQDSRRTYDITYGLQSENNIHAVIELFEAMDGRRIGFRFKDWSDFKSCAPRTNLTPFDQIIGYGDGVTKTFQLTKTYPKGSRSYTRTILKPVANTTRVAIGIVEQTSGWGVDTTTGIVTFITAPPLTSPLTPVRAGYEFDVPVRFDTDKLPINLAQAKASKMDGILLIELPIP